MSPESAKPINAAELAFAGYFVRTCSFRELPHDPARVRAAQTGEKRPVGLNLMVQIGVAHGRAAEVTLQASVTPDPTVQPYEIHVEVCGQFVANEGVTEQSLLAFCQHNAPVILWPYLRAEVQRVSSDARYGATRLDPVNLLGVMERGDGWQTDEHKIPVESAPKN